MKSVAILQRSGRSALLVIVAIGALYGLGVGARRLIVEAQHREHGEWLPFTLESALHFRRIRMLVEGEEIPLVDRAIEYPHGVESAKIYTLGSEAVYARLATLFPESMPLENRLRWVEAGWFCLGIPFLALWIRWWRGSWVGAFCAAAFYAVGLSSVSRSTGLELSRENFAMPFLVLHLALDALSLRVARPRAFWWAAVGSAAALAVALVSWDLIQYYVLLWALLNAAGALTGTLSIQAPGGRLWILQAAALAAVGGASTYHAAHGWLGSFPMLIVYGTALCLGVGAVRARCGRRLPGGWGIPLLALPLVVSWALPGVYGRSYGHFARLLWAKIRFGNVKPMDPSLLDYEARIMWVPALHSSNMELTFQLFPAMLVLAFCGGVLVTARLGRRLDSRTIHLLVYFGVSLAAFWFFVRFHVFLALFSCALIGCWAAFAHREAGAWGRGTAALLLGFGLAIEVGRLVQAPEKWGRGEIYYRELQELVEWAAEHLYPEAVLANFGTSASLLAYAGCPVILHPKFETPEIRERVREYAELLFKGPERAFRDWADRQGAGFYVHGIGEFAVGQPVHYQMRYMVDAVQPPADSPALLFERDPQRLRYFQLLWENRKYRVFRIQTRADEAEAETRAVLAQRAFERGALTDAREAAMEALQIDRNNQRAAEILGRVESLWEKGVTYDASE